MGIFDLLFGKTTPQPQTLVYRTDAEKWSALSKTLADLKPEKTAAVLLVGHFPDTVTRLEKVAEGYQGSIPTLCTLSADCKPELARRLDLQPKLDLVVLVAERHLVSQPDNDLAEFAKAIYASDPQKQKCRLIYHLSLDDPVMRMFAGGWVKGVLEKLGMEEDEAIESAMVTRRIIAAQEKLATKQQGDRPAENAEQWIELNLPEGSFKEAE